MIKQNRISAFSLVEVIVSMFIMVLVVMLTLSSITTKKSNFESKSSISGMYACWMDDDGTLNQKYYSGSVDTNYQPNDRNRCVFQMDRRVSKYTVYAVGSRRNEVNGQVVQAQLITPSGASEDEMTIDITLGQNSNGGMTTVSGNAAGIPSAMGAIRLNAGTGLASGNIMDCKYIGDRSGSVCANNELPQCEVSDNYEEGLRRIGQNPHKTGIKIRCVNRNNVLTNGENECQIDIYSLTRNGVAYNGNCIDRSGVTAVIKIREKDSSLKATTGTLGNSQFVRYLKTIPQNMQNGLTDELLEYYQTGNDKNGVVFIIW